MHPPSAGILLVASGLSTPDASIALAAFERRIQERFPGILLCRAFTARVKERRINPVTGGEESLAQALRFFAHAGVCHVAVQALHVIAGIEHDSLVADIAAYGPGLFPGALSMGKPLLDTEEDVAELAQALVVSGASELGDHEAILWVGHGSRHTGQNRYRLLASHLRDTLPPALVGAMHGNMGIPYILEEMAARHIRSVAVAPLLALPGSHAVHDVWGTNENSWISQLRQAGIACRPLVKGMVEYPHIEALWLRRIEEAVFCSTLPAKV